MKGKNNSVFCYLTFPFSICLMIIYFRVELLIWGIIWRTKNKMKCTIFWPRNMNLRTFFTCLLTLLNFTNLFITKKWIIRKVISIYCSVFKQCSYFWKLYIVSIYLDTVLVNEEMMFIQNTLHSLIISCPALYSIPFTALPLILQHAHDMLIYSL